MNQIPSEGVPMTLVLFEGKPKAAYPRRIQAEVYATGFSSNDKIEFVDGVFVENRPQIITRTMFPPKEG